MQHFRDGEVAESYNRCRGGSKAIAMPPKEGAAKTAGRIQATIKNLEVVSSQESVYCIPVSISPPTMILQKEIVLRKDFVSEKLPKLSFL